MAITNTCFDFLDSNKKIIKWKNVLMIWRQANYLSKEYIKKYFKNIKTNNFSEFIWTYFKVKKIESIDFSIYESPTYIHDMNLEIKKEYYNKFDTIYDWWSTEHVYNIPIAFSNYINMLKLNWTYIWVLPWNNLCNHGFYQFSPDFFYSLFSIENWFKTRVYVKIKNNWFLIKDLRDFDYPIHFNLSLGKKEANLFIIAKKISNKTNADFIPYQTIYSSHLWEKKELRKDKSIVYNILNRYTPNFIKNTIRNYRNNKLILKKIKKPNF